MIIFLYGKDGYRLKQNLEKIVGEYKKKHTSGMSFSVLDASDGMPKNALDKLEDLVKTTSFFNEKRLVVVKNPFVLSKELAVFIKKWSLAEDKERILAFIEYQNESELNKKDKSFYALLAAKPPATLGSPKVVGGKPNLVKNFEPLAGRQLENWIIKETANYGARIEPAAVKKLIAYAGDDSWRLSQEIQKLVNYKNAARATITTADIELLVSPNVDFNIFEVVDAVAGRRRLGAAKLIHEHLDGGADPYYIFSMIVYQFRNLLRVKSLMKNAVPYAVIIKKTGLNPYVVKKTFTQSGAYELDELKKIFMGLSRLDVEAKNGEINLTDGLYRFVFSL